MNQVTAFLQFAPLPELTLEHAQNDFSAPRENTVELLKKEIEALKRTAQNLVLENNSLKQLIDSIYSSPTEKRKLLVVLEKKYKISRRRACRLLSFARSTCWYRPSNPTAEPEVPQAAITTLDTRQLVHRMAKLCRQSENGFIPFDAQLQEQFEYGLKRLGLVHAALLSRTNLKLAMDIFRVWHKRR
ncbi:MAG: hypothetical protein DKT66_24250 [Candidatus Melainabacteria bacterium]|nr:MAG: hypothetical protein DKT66_24250 [Candidatus Melainabacteria bacterium]